MVFHRPLSVLISSTIALLIVPVTFNLSGSPL